MDQNQKPVKRGQLVKRDAQGRFLPGNPGGPGRPPDAPNKRLSTGELFYIARSLDAAELFLLADELHEIEHMLANIQNDDSKTPDTKIAIHAIAANKRLAIMAIHQRLIAELQGA